MEFYLGEWQIDFDTGVISNGDETHRLEPKVAEILLYLVRQKDRVVNRDELLSVGWPDTAVTDDVVWRCIGSLRKTLGDDAKSPRYIETLPRRGYRWIAPTSLIEPTGDENAEKRTGLRSFVRLLVLAACLLPWTGSGLQEPRTNTGEAAPTASYYDLARVYHGRYTAADVNRAIEFYHLASRQDPESAQVWAGLANAYSWRSNQNPEDDVADRAQALEALRKALALDPGSAVVRRAEGMVLQAGGRYREAATAYLRALDLDPSSSPAKYNLARIHTLTGRPHRALELLTELRPDTPETIHLVLSSRAAINYLLGDFEKASGDAESARELDPLALWPALILTKIDLLKGQYQTARRRVTEMIDIGGRDQAALRLAAETEIFAGNHPAARQWLASEPVDPSEPRDPYSLLLSGYLDWAAGDHQAAGTALARCQKAAEAEVAQGHEGWGPWLNLGAAWAIQDRPREALDALERAIDQGFLEYQWLRQHPIFQTLQSSHTFQDLLGRVESRVRIR